MDNALKDLIKRSNISLINANLLLSEDCSKIKKDYNYIYHLAAVTGVQHVLIALISSFIQKLLCAENMLKVAVNQPGRGVRFICMRVNSVKSMQEL